jgi:hypothetical protein
MIIPALGRLSALRKSVPQPRTPHAVLDLRTTVGWGSCLAISQSEASITLHLHSRRYEVSDTTVHSEVRSTLVTRR